MSNIVLIACNIVNRQRGAKKAPMPGDTIVFDAAIQNATITLTTSITINKTLTVSGPGPTISDGNKTRINTAQYKNGL